MASNDPLLDRFVDAASGRLRQYFLNVRRVTKDLRGRTKYVGLTLDKEPDCRRPIHDIFAEIENAAWKQNRLNLCFYIRGADRGRNKRR